MWMWMRMMMLVAVAGLEVVFFLLVRVKGKITA